MTLPALHVDGNGYVRDSSNNIVYLRGVNSAGTEFNTGWGNQSSISFAPIWYTALVNLCYCNLYRLNINASWWNNNVLMPDGITSYQTWIANNIGWIESAGMYVEIACTTAFCTGTTSGTSQNFLDSCNSTVGVVDWDNKIFPIYNTFWSNFITTSIKNDPGVLYNLANEPVVSDSVAQCKTLLSTVRGLDANKVVIIDSRNYYSIASGSTPNYTGSNIIIDWHVYDDTTWWWYQKMSSQQPASSQGDYGTSFTYAQSQGQGTMIGEFNVAGAWNANGFAMEMARRAFATGMGNAYYNDGNLIGGSPLALLYDGTVLAPVNKLIAAGPKAWYGL